MASGKLNFDGLVKELNAFLATEERLYRKGWVGYAMRIWANVLSKSLVHPIYSRPELKDWQKDAVCLASDIVRVKEEVKLKEVELTAEFGTDEYQNMLKFCDDIYNMWKRKFEIG